MMVIPCLCLSRFSSCTATTKKYPDQRSGGIFLGRHSYALGTLTESDGWCLYGLRLLIFPQLLGRALKNQNAAPTTPPCFCRRQRSSLLLFKSSDPQWRASGKNKSAAVLPVDIPTGWAPQRNLVVRALRVAFADFSAAPWQGFEKSERGPNNSSLFQPLAAVVVVAVQVLLSAVTAKGKLPCKTKKTVDSLPPGRHSYRLGTAH